MNPIFNAVGSGSWFWVSDNTSSGIDKAHAINMHQGIKVTVDKTFTQYPVKLLLINNR